MGTRTFLAASSRQRLNEPIDPALDVRVCEGMIVIGLSSGFVADRTPRPSTSRQVRTDADVKLQRFPQGTASPWRAALKRAGLRIRFHDLRHTCITKLTESQASEQTIMAIAGHLSRKMLEHYSHIRMAAKRAALDAIAKPVFAGDVVQNPLQSPEGENTARPN